MRPLRHRSDLVALAEHLLAFFARQSGHELAGFTPQVREALAHHTWPGNLRELRKAVGRSAILANGPEVGVADLPERIAQTRALDGGPVGVGRRVSPDRLEVEHIRRVLGNTASL